MIFRAVLLFLIYLESIECYNQTIMFKDVAKCEELHLEKSKHHYTDIVVPIDQLLYNRPKENELLRMKTFLLGSDFYIEMMSDSNRPVYYNPDIRFYHTVLGGWEGRKSKISISALDGPGLTCGTTDTINLFDRFYFTQLDMVVTKNGRIQYFEHGNLKLECLLEAINITHLAFGIGILGDGRVFYDCPDGF